MVLHEHQRGSLRMRQMYDDLIVVLGAIQATSQP